MTGEAPGPALPARYRLERLIGQGSYGLVFGARDLELDRPVAVKVMARGLTSGSAAERFQREALVTGKLVHPHVVTLFDAGVTEAGEPFIVYEWVEGRDLAARVGPDATLPVPELARYGAELASALSAAHRLGILHRDVKPQNVLVRADDGRAVLCDFGLAGALAGPKDLTRTGAVVGTPRFIAPEVWRGAPPGPAADQYALGAVLYELAFGLPARPEGAEVGIMAGVHPGHVPEVPAAHRGRFPAFEAAVLRALEPDPGRRFPEVGDFGAALAGGRGPGAARAGGGPRISARVPAVPPGRAGIRTPVALALLGLAAAAGVYFARGRAAPGVPEAPGPEAAAPAAVPGSLEALEAAYRDLARTHQGPDGAVVLPSRHGLGTIDDHVHAIMPVVFDPRFPRRWARLLEGVEACLAGSGPGLRAGTDPAARDLWDRAVSGLAIHLMEDGRRIIGITSGGLIPMLGGPDRIDPRWVAPEAQALFNEVRDRSEHAFDRWMADPALADHPALVAFDGSVRAQLLLRGAAPALGRVLRTLEAPDSGPFAVELGLAAVRVMRADFTGGVIDRALRARVLAEAPARLWRGGPVAAGAEPGLLAGFVIEAFRTLGFRSGAVGEADEAAFDRILGELLAAAGPGSEVVRFAALECRELAGDTSFTDERPGTRARRARVEALAGAGP